MRCAFAHVNFVFNFYVSSLRTDHLRKRYALRVTSFVHNKLETNFLFTSCMIHPSASFSSPSPLRPHLLALRKRSASLLVPRTTPFEITCTRVSKTRSRDSVFVAVWEALCPCPGGWGARIEHRFLLAPCHESSLC